MHELENVRELENGDYNFVEFMLLTDNNCKSYSLSVRDNHYHCFTNSIKRSSSYIRFLKG